VSRVNEHYNGYIVGCRDLYDLRDNVLKAGTTNFVTDATVGRAKNVTTHIIQSRNNERYDRYGLNYMTDICRGQIQGMHYFIVVVTLSFRQKLLSINLPKSF
jgi:restriction endonuclease S subunit